jgi:micrococcal nuclease
MSPNKKSKNRRVRRRQPLARRMRRLLYFAVALAFTGLFLAQRTDYLPAAPGSDREIYHNRIFAVIKVVDGDTIDLDRSDGDQAYTRVRLWGMDTPETKHPRGGVMYYGPEAARFTEKLVLDREVTIVLEPFEKSRDKYGRLLAYVYLPDGAAASNESGQSPDKTYGVLLKDQYFPSGKMLNEELISQGYAYADERFGHVLKERFLLLQKQAQREKRGLWKEVQPHQWPEWYRKRHDPDFSE